MDHNKLFTSYIPNFRVLMFHLHLSTELNVIGVLKCKLNSGGFCVYTCLKVKLFRTFVGLEKESAFSEAKVS